MTLPDSHTVIWALAAASSFGAADPAQGRQEHPQGSTDSSQDGIKPIGFALRGEFYFRALGEPFPPPPAELEVRAEPSCDTQLQAGGARGGSGREARDDPCVQETGQGWWWNK